MKKLLSLLVVSAAAFAGGGLLNEHNLTTAVNFLYHKQQIGKVISLGSIADTPPVDLPDTLPTAPGAAAVQVAQPATNAPIQGQPELAAGPAGGMQTQSAPDSGQGQAQANTQVASTQPVVPPPPIDSKPAYEPTPIPASPPPPLSIHWPNEQEKTYRAVPVEPSRTEPATQLGQSLPPPAPAKLGEPPAPIGNLSPDGHQSGSPAQLAGNIALNAQQVPPVRSLEVIEKPPLRDQFIDRAGYGSPAGTPPPSSSNEATWEELVKKLQDSGVQKMEMTFATGGRLKLRCELTLAGTQKPQVIESDGTTPQAAAQLALRRIILYKASRLSRVSKPEGSPMQDGPAMDTANHAATLPVTNRPYSRRTLPEEIPTNSDSGLPPPPPADVPQ